MTPKIAILLTHPIQYYSPWFRELANRREAEFEILYCFQPTAEQQGAAYGVKFEWNVPLLDGYSSRFLKNVAINPGSHFEGCNTPEVEGLIRSREYSAWIICGWNVRSYWQAIRTCYKEHVPMAVRGDSHLLTRRSLVKRVAKRFLHGRWIPRFNACLTVGELNRQYYLHYGAKPENLIPVRHFVGNDWFWSKACKALPLRSQIRKQWNIPEESVIFLFCGRLIDWKHPLDLLLAAAKVREEFSNFHILIAGEGVQRGECEILAQKLSIPTSFTGFVNQGELPDVYAAADVLVLPSDAEETWGLVVNEAMASGCPAIVSNRVGCGPDLIHPGKTGYIFEYQNIDDLAQKMKRYCESPQLAEEQGRAARDLVNRRYSISGAADRTIEAVLKIT